MTPRLQRKFAVGCLVASIVLWPVAHVTGWITSVIFVNELSLGAIVLGVAASHLEVQRDEEDVPREVVAAIKADPDLPGGNDMEATRTDVEGRS